MKYRLQFRRYLLPFRGVVRTAHGVWAEREGVIVRLEDERGNVGWGEAAPIPAFGTETIDEAEMGCRALGEWTSAEAIAGLPARLGCVRHALATAEEELSRGSSQAANEANVVAEPAGERRYLGVAALLPAGRAAIAQIAPRAEVGFRVFKWKVGVGDLADELALLDDVCAELPSGGKLRLDANGAWDRRQAERWLERCAERPVEFVEQPCFAPSDGASAFAKATADKSSDSARQRKIEELLLGLAADYPTPIALDESLVGEGDVERWIGAGWPGVFVVKPSLVGDLAGALARLEKAAASVVFSSALETAVGARSALRAAFAWKGEPRALGFGVWPLFVDGRFDGPAAAPFLRVSDVERINPEAIWTALG